MVPVQHTLLLAVQVVPQIYPVPGQAQTPLLLQLAVAGHCPETLFRQHVVVGMQFPPHVF
jgi:hypothetical protein